MAREAHMYDEASARFYNDAEFRAAVELTMAMALKHGFTPYELKQIAYCASLRIELYDMRRAQQYDR